MQLARRFILTNFRFRLQEHVARIQTSVHKHGCHAGFLIAPQDRPLDRRRAAQPRQQRCMHIDAPIWGEIQHRLRQNFTICHHHNELRIQRLELSKGCLRFNRGRLVNGNTGFQRRLFDRRRHHRIASPLGLIGLCEHA